MKPKRKQRARHGTAFKYFSSGRKCRDCGRKKYMNRMFKETKAVDTRHFHCFRCIPSMEHMWEEDHVEYYDSRKRQRQYPLHGRYF